jgi:tetrapyrrole methylase family protein/MazG family protein
MTADEAFKGLCDIVARLRAPDGCPWDREQTPSTLRGDLIEETYECVEAIDEKDGGHIKEELGDLFLLVTMLSYMHEQEGLFAVADVLETVSAKLIRRHPHVCGETKVKDRAEGLENWRKIKVEQEGRKPKDSILDEVSRGLPPLDRAYKLQKKAAKAGFDWPELKGVLAKLEEEIAEAGEAIKALESAGSSEESARAGMEEELGDVLFSAVNLCRYLHVDPSVALQRTNAKFTRRFTHVEKQMKAQGYKMEHGNLSVMDTFWEEAKTADV